jgi:polyisoprenoid-binding protein YceI
MKPLFMLLLTFLLCCEVSLGQQHTYTGNGQVTFSGGAPLDLIKGTSSAITGSIDLETGKVYFEIPIKSFEFPNSLMQERFNDKYMQSDRFPKAIFKGQLANFTPNSNAVTVNGVLQIHGVAKRRSIKGTLVRHGNEFILQSLFVVNTKDHHIESPKLTSGFMAENINVNLRLQMVSDYNPAQVVMLSKKEQLK